MEGVGQLTGGIAHDFNNLLAVTMGNLSLLDDALPVDSALKPLIEPALRAVDRGASLTQRLLAFSRSQTLQVAAVDSGGLYELLSRSLGEDIDLELEIEPGLWLCEADPGQLEQAILNLAINSRDAMPHGGRLMIAVENSTLDQAVTTPIGNAKAGDYITVSVTDEGVGIAPDALEHIFEPFFTTKRTGAGTGLGLSMVYGFITQSGGYLTVDTKLGEGTRVGLCLPRHADAVSPTPAPAAKPLAIGAGETVPVVDDDPDILEMVGRQVSSLGYRTLAASTGAEAVEGWLFDRSSPDRRGPGRRHEPRRIGPRRREDRCRAEDNLHVRRRRRRPDQAHRDRRRGRSAAQALPSRRPGGTLARRFRVQANRTLVLTARARAARIPD
jgi:hypothetical protein